MSITIKFWKCEACGELHRSAMAFDLTPPLLDLKDGFPPCPFCKGDIANSNIHWGWIKKDAMIVFKCPHCGRTLSGYKSSVNRS